MDQPCVFCKIELGTIPAKKIAENEHVFVIADRAPQAPVHYLIIAKKHYPDITAVHPDETEVMASFFLMAQHLSQLHVSNGAFKLHVNNGAAAGQSVFHVHMHFLAGEGVSQGWRV